MSDDVKFWRNDAIEASAVIAERMGESHVATEIRKLLDGTLEPTHYAVIDEHGEIVQAFKVKSIISAKEDCVRFIASISKFQDDPDRLKGWTVKGVTVHG